MTRSFRSSYRLVAAGRGEQEHERRERRRGAATPGILEILEDLLGIEGGSGRIVRGCHGGWPFPGHASSSSCRARFRIRVTVCRQWPVSSAISSTGYPCKRSSIMRRCAGLKRRRTCSSRSARAAASSGARHAGEALRIQQEQALIAAETLLASDAAASRAVCFRPSSWTLFRVMATRSRQRSPRSSKTKRPSRAPAKKLRHTDCTTSSGSTRWASRDDRCCRVRPMRRADTLEELGRGLLVPFPPARYQSQ